MISFGRHSRKSFAGEHWVRIGVAGGVAGCTSPRLAAMRVDRRLGVSMLGCPDRFEREDEWAPLEDRAPRGGLPLCPGVAGGVNFAVDEDSVVILSTGYTHHDTRRSRT